MFGLLVLLIIVAGVWCFGAIIVLLMKTLLFFATPLKYAIGAGALALALAIAWHLNWNAATIMGAVVPLGLILLIVLPIEWQTFISRSPKSS